MATPYRHGSREAAEALSYNALVRSWPELTRLARDSDALRSAQDSPSLF